MTPHRRAVLAGAAATGLAGLAPAKAAPKAPIATTRYGRVRCTEDRKSVV